ncbi:toll/interleukin-1 receptor domain-containing protein [Dactylosporangium sp. NPDC049525]|uniref:toll/interleukin-1 receptor domain-containing protein n=1 Tax=Dactylosporangium sp. NPDC049525 TaxID=3154730 RepID=UPI00342357DE
MRPSVFISHSSRDDAYATELRTRLVAALDERGLDAWLDERRLGAGDRWRAEIYRHLVNCVGAVLLLTPEALESPWVRKEATILCFRGSLSSRLRLVPVLLGTVREHEVQQAFPALYLEEYQFESAHGRDVEEVVAAVADRFGRDDPAVPEEMARWTVRVKGMLRAADDDVVRLAASLLLPGEDTDLDDGRETLAHALLHGSTEGAYAALATLRGQGVDLRQLVEDVVPGYVRAEVAGPVWAAMHADPRQAVVVNASMPETATVLVRRASYCSPHLITIYAGAVGTEQTVESVVADARRALAQRLGMPQPPGQAFLAAQRLLVAVVVSADGVARRTVERLIQRLRAEWQSNVLLVLSDHVDGQVDTQVMVRLAERYEADLLDHVQGMRSVALPWSG